MVKFVLVKVFTLLFLEFSMSVLGKICSKNLVLTFKVISFDPVTMKPYEKIQSKSTFVFVCCDGYREVRRTRVQPVCEPICKTPCGHGVCYSPDKCICDPGYMLTKSTCKAVPITPSTTDQINTASTVPDTILLPSLFAENKDAPDPVDNLRCEKCSSGTCILGTCKCATGYQLTQDGDCMPICDKCLNGRCSAPYHCECLPDYSYDSETRQCKPLCNGKIYGCIRGTCVGYNQCRCDNGTVLLDNERFICAGKEPLTTGPGFNYMWLLLVPLILVVLGTCIVILVWRRGSRKYSGSQGESFPEVTYSNTGSDHTTKFNECYSDETLPMTGTSTTRGNIHRNGNVVIIRT